MPANNRYSDWADGLAAVRQTLPPKTGAFLATRVHVPTATPEPTWSLFRRVRSYRRAGFLVGLLEFLRRRDACRKCDRATTRPTHPGLYGCGSCSSCTGGPERMLTTSTTCPMGKW